MKLTTTTENKLLNDFTETPVKYMITYTRLPNANSTLIFDGLSK